MHNKILTYLANQLQFANDCSVMHTTQRQKNLQFHENCMLKITVKACANYFFRQWD